MGSALHHRRGLLDHAQLRRQDRLRVRRSATRRARQCVFHPGGARFVKGDREMKLLACAIALIIIGCSSMSARTGPNSAALNSESEKGAAQLWSENCNRCHNYRPASTYNDYQW